MGRWGAVGAPCPQHACTQAQPRHTNGHTQRANTLWSLEALTCKYRLRGRGTQLASLPITTWSPRIGLTFLAEDPTASLVSGHLGTWKGCYLDTWAKGLPWQWVGFRRPFWPQSGSQGLSPHPRPWFCE